MEDGHIVLVPVQVLACDEAVNARRDRTSCELAWQEDWRARGLHSVLEVGVCDWRERHLQGNVTIRMTQRSRVSGARRVRSLRSATDGSLDCI